VEIYIAERCVFTSGAHKMWESCENPSSKQSRDFFSEGLENVIDARDVFTTL